jgi:hypothetical protein
MKNERGTASVRRLLRRDIFEHGYRPHREHLTTFHEGALQISDVSRLNTPIASTKSERSSRDLCQICDVKPGLVTTLVTNDQ